MLTSLKATFGEISVCIYLVIYMLWGYDWEGKIVKTMSYKNNNNLKIKDKKVKFWRPNLNSGTK